LYHTDIDGNAIIHQIDTQNLIKKEPNNFAGLFWVEFQMKFVSVVLKIVKILEIYLKNIISEIFIFDKRRSTTGE